MNCKKKGYLSIFVLLSNIKTVSKHPAFYIRLLETQNEEMSVRNLSKV